MKKKEARLGRASLVIVAKFSYPVTRPLRLFRDLESFLF